MNPFVKLRCRLRALFRRGAVEHEMREEMRLHLELLAERNAAAGLSAEDARYAAMRQFGGVEQIKERVREQRGLGWLDQGRQDLRYAVRQVRRNPGFTATVVLTLALAIGANTAIFSFFRGILLRPLAYEKPERVVLFKKEVGDFAEPMGVGVGLLAADFRDLQRRTPSLADIATYTLDAATVTGRGTSMLAVATITTRNFFTLLGAKAALGRTFSPADEKAGRLAVLAHGFWQTRLGGDPAIVGQTITLNKVSFTVVGVMGAEFEFPRETHLWVTPAENVPESVIGQRSLEFGGRGNYLRTIIGRLAPGVSLTQAETEVSGVIERLPNPNATQRAIHLVNMRDQSVGNVRPALIMLLSCVGLVLLIAGLNVANLMLSRAATRQREIGVRLALGAGRGRIARQLLTESVVLALLGGAAGVLLSGWGLNLLVHIAPASLPRLAAVRVDGFVLSFALGLSVLTGLISGLAPVWSAARSDLVTLTKSADRGGSAAPGSRRLRAGLVAGEVAIALMLLVAAGLLLRSMEKMRAFTWGFDPAQVVSARVAFLDERYREDAAKVGFYHALLEKLTAMPGFESVGMSLDRVGQTWIHLPVTPEGQVYANPADRPEVNYRIISPDYFRALGVPLVQGRAFTATDDQNGPRVAIIDAAMARRYFPSGNAVGKRVQIVTFNGSDAWREIVGVVAAVKSDGPGAEGRADVYLPYLQTPLNSFYVHIRTKIDATTAGAMLTRALREIDASVPIFDLANMEEITAKPADARRFPLGLLGGFATLAVGLAAIGIYGVTAYGVVQRTREIGVRMALGARPQAVIALVLRQGLHPLAVGMRLGLAGSVAVAFAMRNLLFGVEPLDAPVFLAIPLILATVTLLACAVPAQRATRVNPVEALRAE